MGNSLPPSRCAVAVLIPEKDARLSGTILFDQQSPYEQVVVTFNVKGPPGSTHAIHVHEYGDTREGCKSLGDHYNPFDAPHGSWKTRSRRHMGDLINNLTFDQNGDPILSKYTDLMLTLYGSYSLYGRSVVMHRNQDDEGRGGHPTSLTTGNSGERIAHGIIAMAKRL